MEKQTNQHIELLVTRDGDIDTSYARAAQRARMGTMLKYTTSHAIAATRAYMAAKAQELVTPVALDMHDAIYGTELRQEYFAHKRELATTALRDLIDIDE